MRYRTALLILTLLAFGLRVAGLDEQSFWLDEVDAIAMASEPVRDQLRKFTAIGENGPLYFLIFRVWIAIAGTTEFGARYLSTLASTLAVPLIAAVTLRLFRRPRLAVLAATLAALSPFYVWFGQDAKMYPHFAALALGAQYALLRGMAGGGAWTWVGYVVASSLALYIHLFAALQIAANTVAGTLLLIAQRWKLHPTPDPSPERRGEHRWTTTSRDLPRPRRAETPLSLWGRNNRALAQRERRALGGAEWGRGWGPPELWGFGISTALLILPYLPLAVWQAPVLLAGADVGYRPVTLPTIFTGLAEQFTWHLNRHVDPRLVAMVFVVSAYGLWRAAVTPGEGRSAAVLLCWLLVPLAFVYALQFTVPVFRDRYLIPLVASLLIVFARAILPLNLPGTLAAVFVVASFGYGLLHRPPNPDFRAAAALVHDLRRPHERVGFLAGYTERPFVHYYRQLVDSNTGTPYERASLPYTDHPGWTESHGMAAVATSLRGGETLWIVRFEDWLWDSRDLATQYLRNRGAERTLYQDFHGVSVSRWQLP